MILFLIFCQPHPYPRSWLLAVLVAYHPTAALRCLSQKPGLLTTSPHPACRHTDFGLVGISAERLASQPWFWLYPAWQRAAQPEPGGQWNAAPRA
jgi:hypothetical protein